jgi:hypothetical protein
MRRHWAAAVLPVAEVPLKLRDRGRCSRKWSRTERHRYADAARHRYELQWNDLYLLSARGGRAAEVCPEQC